MKEELNSEEQLEKKKKKKKPEEELKETLQEKFDVDKDAHILME